MGPGLPQFSTTDGGSGLQSLLHLSELRVKDSVEDLRDELDQASAERLSTGYTHAGCYASEESDLLLMGKTAMDKNFYLRVVPRIDMDRELFPD